MQNALDVARYFLCRVDREAGDTISPLKLQKLVYYAQAWSLAIRNQPLFAQTIEAWVSGPVVRDVWDEYQAYKYRDIPAPDTLDATFDADELEILSEVWDAYGELSAKRLQDLSHSESPWLNARQNLDPAQKSTHPISHEEMQSYYANLVEA